MKFLDKISLNHKLANVAKPRNEKMMERINRSVGNPLKSLLPIYLGKFFQGIYDDNNCTEVLSAFANAEEDTLDEVNRLLVFWFYWSLGQADRHLLAQKDIQDDMREIWSIDSMQFNELARRFDSLKDGGEHIVYLWELICKKLHNESLSPVFAFMHLRNAMVNTLQEIS